MHWVAAPSQVFVPVTMETIRSVWLRPHHGQRTQQEGRGSVFSDGGNSPPRRLNFALFGKVIPLNLTANGRDFTPPEGQRVTD